MKPINTLRLAAALLLGTVASAKPVDDLANFVSSINVDNPIPANAAGGVCLDPNFTGGCRYIIADGLCHNFNQEDPRLDATISSIVVDHGKRCHFSVNNNCPSQHLGVGAITGPRQVPSLPPQWNDRIASYVCYDVSSGGGQADEVPTDTSLFSDEVAEWNFDGVIEVEEDAIELIEGNATRAMGNDAAIACYDYDFRGFCYVMLNDNKCRYLKRKGVNHLGRFSSISVRPGHRCSLWDTDRCNQNIGRVPGIGPFLRIDGPKDIYRMEDRHNDRTLSYACKRL